MSKKCEEGDFVLPGPLSENGGQYVLRHTDNHELEVGIISPVIDGKPIHGDLVQLDKRETIGYNIKFIYKNNGPPKVTNESYRNGWDDIWGKKELDNVN
jgi:hypothetical protein